MQILSILIGNIIKNDVFSTCTKFSRRKFPAKGECFSMKNVVTPLIKRLFKNLFNSCKQYFYVETLCITRGRKNLSSFRRSRNSLVEVVRKCSRKRECTSLHKLTMFINIFCIIKMSDGQKRIVLLWFCQLLIAILFNYLHLSVYLSCYF